jgi:hypothetical protein
MARYFVNASGKYLGGFDGANPPANAIEVPTPPDSIQDQWLNGAWVPNLTKMKAAVLEEARSLRAPVLSILDGMQVSALTNDEEQQAVTIETLKQGLKDITLIDLSGYTTRPQMRTAIALAYKALADSAPSDVKSAFTDLLLAMQKA